MDQYLTGTKSGQNATYDASRYVRQRARAASLRQSQQQQPTSTTTSTMGRPLPIRPLNHFNCRSRNRRNQQQQQQQQQQRRRRLISDITKNSFEEKHSVLPQEKEQQSYSQFRESFTFSQKHYENNINIGTTGVGSSESTAVFTLQPFASQTHPNQQQEEEEEEDNGKSNNQNETFQLSLTEKNEQGHDDNTSNENIHMTEALQQSIDDLINYSPPEERKKWTHKDIFGH